jgi:uncharacterized membrane protein YbhN (UPF0104 family)
MTMKGRMRGASCQPHHPPIGFITMMVPFLTATLLGTVSHAAGGLGVIEVTMLLGLPQFQREELLAALLTFRALYVVLPLPSDRLTSSLTFSVSHG